MFFSLRAQFFAQPVLEPLKAFQSLNERRQEIRKETEKCLTQLISRAEINPDVTDIQLRQKDFNLRHSDIKSDDSDDSTSSSKSSSSTVVKKPTHFLRPLSVTPPPEPASSPPPLEPFPIVRIVPIKVSSPSIRRATKLKTKNSISSRETEVPVPAIPKGDRGQVFTLLSQTKEELRSRRRDLEEEEEEEKEKMSLWDSRASQVRKETKVERKRGKS